jgi:hypothetical protein
MKLSIYTNGVALQTYANYANSLACPIHCSAWRSEPELQQSLDERWSGSFRPGMKITMAMIVPRTDLQTWFRNPIKRAQPNPELGLSGNVEMAQLPCSRELD